MKKAPVAVALILLAGVAVIGWKLLPSKAPPKIPHSGKPLEDDERPPPGVVGRPVGPPGELVVPLTLGCADGDGGFFTVMLGTDGSHTRCTSTGDNSKPLCTIERVDAGLTVELNAVLYDAGFDALPEGMPAAVGCSLSRGPKQVNLEPGFADPTGKLKATIKAMK